MSIVGGGTSTFARRLWSPRRAAQRMLECLAAHAMTRVLRIITRLNIGGPSIQAIMLTERLAARGFDTRLVHGHLGAGEGDMRYVMKSPAAGHYIPTLRRPIAPLHDTMAFGQILDVLRDFRPHIVHTHMAKAGTIGRAAAAFFNRTAGRDSPARVVHTYHGHVLDGYFGPTRPNLFMSMERRLARITDRLVAISPTIHDELVGKHRIGRPDQYRVIPLGFELQRMAAIGASERQAARVALALAPDAHVISTAGRLTAIKRHDLFLDVARLIADRDAHAIFLIAGDGE